MAKTQNQVIQDIWQMILDAQDNNSSHVTYIQEMHDIYKANYPTNEKSSAKKTRSSIVVRDAKNAATVLKSKLVLDFTGSDSVIDAVPQLLPEDIVMLQQNPQYMRELQNKARDLKYKLEYDYKYSIDPILTNTIIAHFTVIEGQAIAKTYYEYEVEASDVQKIPEIPQEQYGAMVEEIYAQGYALIKEGDYKEGDPTVKNIEYGKLTVKKSKPNLKILQNNDFAIDPAATSIQDARWVVEQYEMTLSDIRMRDVKRNPVGGDLKNTESLIDKIKAQPRLKRNEIETSSYSLDTSNSTYNIENSPLHSVLIYKFTGYYDENDDGIAELREIEMTDNGVILKDIERTSKVKFPYVQFVADRDPYEKYGISKIEDMDGTQKARVASMRFIVESMALMINRNKFIDETRLPMGERERLALNIPGMTHFVTGNPNDIVKELENSPTPPSVFQGLSYLGLEGQKASGVSDMWQGIGNSPSMAKTATAASIAAQGSDLTYQYLFNNIRSGWEEVFRQWQEYYNEYVDDSEQMAMASKVAGNTEIVQMRGKDIKGQFKITVIVQPQGWSQMKAQQEMMSFQMTQPLVQFGVLTPTELAQQYARIQELQGNKLLAQKIMSRVEVMESQEFQQLVMQQAQQMAQQMMAEYAQSPEFINSVKQDATEMAQAEHERMMREESQKGETK